MVPPIYWSNCLTSVEVTMLRNVFEKCVQILQIHFKFYNWLFVNLIICLCVSGARWFLAAQCTSFMEDSCSRVSIIILLSKRRLTNRVCKCYRLAWGDWHLHFMYAQVALHHSQKIGIEMGQIWRCWHSVLLMYF